MTGICDNGHQVHWRNTRGSRKPDQCPQCDAPVKPARWDGTKYVAANIKGGKMMPCSLCSHKVKINDENRATWIISEDAVFEVTHHEPYRREKEKALAGSVVCWRHTRIDEATGNYIYAR